MTPAATALSPPSAVARVPAPPPLREALRTWARIGCLSFGGPAAQIALMHRAVVAEHRWVSDRRFLHALNFCFLLPGPEATQLATYLGWLLHGVRGGVLAGLLFVLPGAAVMLALTLLYVTLGAVPLVAALFFGLRCAVLVLVAEALWRVSRRALRGPAAILTALAAFVALFALAAPFPLAVLVAGLFGAALPGAFASAPPPDDARETPALLDAILAADPGRLVRMAPVARRAGLAALALWLWPAALLWDAPLWGDLAWFFSRMAAVTFGGAYAVLAYVAQEAVERYGWLSAADMLAGLGLAETTPGPLILVLQFVGFLAAWREHGPGGGALGAALTLWVTFVPCFAWIFLGAPFVERLHDVPRLRGALAGVGAAVVGVIGNLALWLALRTLFARLAPARLGPFTADLPVPTSLDPAALALTLLATALLFGARLGVPATLGLTALAGLGARLLGF